MAQSARKQDTWDWQHETPWRVSDDGKERVRATYGLHRFMGQEPYFSLTADIQELRGGKWREAGGGAAHEEIARAFPELAPYARWHLTSTAGPMHYLANSMYFWDQAAGDAVVPPGQRVDPTEAFAKTAVIGALPEDPEPKQWVLGMSRQDVVDALNERLPAVMEKFKADMAHLRDNPIGEGGRTDVEAAEDTLDAVSALLNLSDGLVGSPMAFAQRHGVEMECQGVAQPLHTEMPAGSFHWRCRLRNGGTGASMTVPFSMGPALGSAPPAIGTVLGTLGSDAASWENAKIFEEWASELGFDLDDPAARQRAKRTFNAVERQAEALKRLLGDEAYDELLWHTDQE